MLAAISAFAAHLWYLSLLKLNNTGLEMRNPVEVKVPQHLRKSLNFIAQLLRLERYKYVQNL